MSGILTVRTVFESPTPPWGGVGIMARMAAMNDTFASTCALTIPVLALAGYIEVRAIFKLLGDFLRNRDIRSLPVLPVYVTGVLSILITCAGWVVLMWYSVWSEDACLNYMLTHEQAQGDANANPVKFTLLWLLIMLVFLPTLGLIVNAMGIGSAEGVNEFTRHRSARSRRNAESSARRPTKPTAHGTDKDPSSYLG